MDKKNQYLLRNSGEMPIGRQAMLAAGLLVLIIIFGILGARRDAQYIAQLEESRQEEIGLTDADGIAAAVDAESFDNVNNDN